MTVSDPQAPIKVGSRWTSEVRILDEEGCPLLVRRIRPCRTRREAQARADIVAAKLSKDLGFSHNA